MSDKVKEAIVMIAALIIALGLIAWLALMCYWSLRFVWNGAEAFSALSALVVTL